MFFISGRRRKRFSVSRCSEVRIRHLDTKLIGRCIQDGRQKRILLLLLLRYDISFSRFVSCLVSYFVVGQSRTGPLVRSLSLAARLFNVSCRQMALLAPDETQKGKTAARRILGMTLAYVTRVTGKLRALSGAVAVIYYIHVHVCIHV